MTHFFGFLLSVVMAITIGLGATYLSVAHWQGFGRVKAGPWSVAVRAGAPDAEPYTRAIIARSGEIPLSPGEGIVLASRSDSKGVPLNGGCLYRVTGTFPPARIWTLTAYTPEGQLIANPAERFGFSSAEVVRDASGAVDIMLGAQVQPGNWLPVAEQRPFALVLRLYDTPISASAARLEAKTVPEILKTSCP